MTVAITMQQTRRGEDGSLWTAGGTYTASDGFAALMVTGNFATVAKPHAPTVPADLSPADSGPTAIPARVVPYAPSGTVYYVDPSASAHGDGAFLTPYKDLRDKANPAVGSSILFKAGTTYQPSGGFIEVSPAGLPADATEAVVFGVYDAATGARLSGRGAGLATIDGQNTQPFGIRVDADLHANAAAFVCLDGLKVINTLGSGNGRIKLKSLANCQVLNCDVSDSLAKGIYSDSATGTNYFEGNVERRCGEAGIVETLAADTSSVFQFNSVGGIDISGAHAFAGRAECNSIQGVTGRTSNGIAIDVASGASRIARNAIRQCKNGVSYASTSAPFGDFAGSVVEDNDIELCKNGVQLGNVSGVVCQKNRIDRSGTFDGTSAYDSGDNFGRGFELYGLTVGPQKCVIRFNTITRTFSINPDGSEGVGIGFDNNATDCIAYGNLIVDSYGCGIQANRTIRCTAASNIVINSWCAPAGAYPSFTYTSGRLEGAVTHIVSPGWTAANNTVVCGVGFYSRYGMAEAYHTTDGGSPGASLINNLILGAPVAGILLDDGAGKSTESHNVIQGNAGTLSATSQASIALGSGTHLVESFKEAGLSGDSFVPALDSLCDATGTTVNPALLSFAGAALAHRTPIGAFHAGGNTPRRF